MRWPCDTQYLRSIAYNVVDNFNDILIKIKVLINTKYT